MTINQLFRELQRLKLDGCGEFEVMIKDFTDEPPVAEPIGSVKVLKTEKRVLIQSLTVEQMLANDRKMLQKQAKVSKW